MSTQCRHDCTAPLASFKVLYVIAKKFVIWSFLSMWLDFFLHILKEFSKKIKSRLLDILSIMLKSHVSSPVSILFNEFPRKKFFPKKEIFYPIYKFFARAFSPKKFSHLNKFIHFPSPEPFCKCFHYALHSNGGTNLVSIILQILKIYFSYDWVLQVLKFYFLCDQDWDNEGQQMSRAKGSYRGNRKKIVIALKGHILYCDNLQILYFLHHLFLQFFSNIYS